MDSTGCESNRDFLATVIREATERKDASWLLTKDSAFARSVEYDTVQTVLANLVQHSKSVEEVRRDIQTVAGRLKLWGCGGQRVDENEWTKKYSVAMAVLTKYSQTLWSSTTSPKTATESTETERALFEARKTLKPIVGLPILKTSPETLHTFGLKMTTLQGLDRDFKKSKASGVRRRIKGLPPKYRDAIESVANFLLEDGLPAIDCCRLNVPSELLEQFDLYSTLGSFLKDQTDLEMHTADDIARLQ